jgi:hypothetical protein
VQLQQLAADLRIHRHRVERLYRAQRDEIDRHVLAHHRFHRDRHRRGLAAFAAGAAMRAGRGAGTMQQAEAEHQHDEHHEDDQGDLPETRHGRKLRWDERRTGPGSRRAGLA